MPVIRVADAMTFEVHGSRFDSYVRPAAGRTDLCAWRLVVPAGLPGAAHTPDRDEVLLVLSGALDVTLDGSTASLGAGDVAHVRAGSQLRVDGGPDGGTAWVTTTPGLTATMADGTAISPAWAQ